MELDLSALSKYMVYDKTQWPDLNPCSQPHIVSKGFAVVYIIHLDNKIHHFIPPHYARIYYFAYSMPYFSRIFLFKT